MKTKDTSLLWIGAMILLSYCSLAFADNEIIISQAGDNFDLLITQQGYNNTIQGVNGTGQVLGADNTININQGYKGNNLIELATNGTGNEITIGQEKSVGYTPSGIIWFDDTSSYGHHYAKADISGNYNDVEILQRNNNSSVAGHDSYAIVTNGDYNSIRTLQTGTGGSSGHTSYVHVKNGRDGNDIDVFQNSDTADHSITLSVYSNYNTIDVSQTGTTSNRAYVLFSADSVGPTNFTLNQSGGSTYGSSSYVTQYCANPGGCTVTVNQGP